VRITRDYNTAQSSQRIPPPPVGEVAPQTLTLRVERSDLEGKVDALRQEVAALREQIKALAEKLEKQPPSAK
jgi:hypothetical protein